MITPTKLFVGQIIMENSTTALLSTNKLLLIAGTDWLFVAMDVGLLSFILAALKQDWGLTPSQLAQLG